MARRFSRFFISGGRPLPFALTFNTCVRTLLLPSALVTVVVVVRVVLPKMLVDVLVFTSVRDAMTTSFAPALEQAAAFSPAGAVAAGRWGTRQLRGARLKPLR